MIVPLLLFDPLLPSVNAPLARVSWPLLANPPLPDTDRLPPLLIVPSFTSGPVPFRVLRVAVVKFSEPLLSRPVPLTVNVRLPGFTKSTAPLFTRPPFVVKLLLRSVWPLLVRRPSNVPAT